MTKAYFKMFQVKYRRRRGQFSVGNRVCNNNAYMVIKDSYLESGEQFGEPACTHCLNQSVQTNKDIVAQITYATLAGDIVLTAVYAHELPCYGLKGGFTNYAAGMCSVWQSKIIFESTWSK
jgi:large subunit ribosomal protein L5e